MATTPPPAPVDFRWLIIGPEGLVNAAASTSWSAGQIAAASVRASGARQTVRDAWGEFPDTIFDIATDAVRGAYVRRFA